MKKFYLMVALSLMPMLTANAQGKEYCELIGTQHITKFSVAIDFGQQDKRFPDDQMVDEKGKLITFNSMVDAMNYMSKLGWEFRQAYVVVRNTGLSGDLFSSYPEYHWILSKETEDVEPLVLKAIDIPDQEQHKSE